MRSRCRVSAIAAAQSSPQSLPQFPIPKLTGFPGHFYEGVLSDPPWLDFLAYPLHSRQSANLLS